MEIFNFLFFPVELFDIIVLRVRITGGGGESRRVIVVGTE